MAIGTFAIRWSVLGAMREQTFGPQVERALTLVLPAIFAAIAIPMLILGDGGPTLRDNGPKLLAALVTLATAMVRRGYLLPLILGMLTLHAMQWALRL
jgi:branched-subunit amino acid transport protein